MKGSLRLLALVLVLAPAALAGAAPGSWQRLPAAPIAAPESPTAAWTGKELLVVGRYTKRAADGAVSKRALVAAAYDPRARAWHELPSPGPTGSFLGLSSAWTGRELLVWGQGMRQAFDPARNRWRQLPGSRLLSIHDGFGLVAWTGRELVGWGGGCCGDAFSDGVAYSPATDSWHALARSPLAGSQHPIGAWTGRELIVLVGGLDPDGKPWPKRFARAAAYNPRTDTWRRIAPLPAPRGGASAVWDGKELLVVGGASDARSRLPRVGFAYDPGTNRWRRLPPMPSGRTNAAAVWTGKHLLLWGGQTGRPASPVIASRGFVYDPRTNRWTTLPRAPIRGRLDPTAVWTGRSLIVWGGVGSDLKKAFADGAAFTP